MKKRILSILLALCMVLCLLPTVFAEGTDPVKAIQHGAAGFKGPVRVDVGSNKAYYTPGSYLYFGTNDSAPIKWRVLDAEKASDGSEGVFLLSEYLLANDVQFSSDLLKNAWNGSNAQSWCKDFAGISGDSVPDAFSEAERSAIAETTKDDAAGRVFGGRTEGIYFQKGSLTKEKVFFLSGREASDYLGNYHNAPQLIACDTDGAAAIWWFRSPYVEDPDSTYAGVSRVDGRVNAEPVTSRQAARPAFNLDAASVLFRSPAENGKNASRSGLEAVGEYTGNEWKLTVIDAARSTFAAATTKVEGNVLTFSYQNAKTGANEYLSAITKDAGGNVTCYGRILQLDGTDGTAVVTLPDSFNKETDALCIFNEQCNGDKKTDYASALQNMELSVALPQEPTPSAVFAAAGDNGGTLSNVDTSMKFSLDGGTTWNNITGETMEITGVTAENDVKVYRPGNDVATADSEVQTIDVTQAAQPTGIDKTDCTTSKQNNGQITGVDATMEYRRPADAAWTAITGNSVAGLSNGTYEVRVKASGTVLASGAATVTIGAHTCVAQGDWQYDGTGHWKLCACGAKVDKAVHTGGKATCVEKAACEVCGESYGEPDATNHTDLKHFPAKAAAATTEGNLEYWYCAGCDRYFSEAAATKEIKKADTVTAKLPEDGKSPQTFDSSNLMLWIALLLISGAGILAAVYGRKHKHKEH